MISKYLEAHNLTPDIIYKNRIIIHYTKNEIEIPVRDEMGRCIFSKFRVFGVDGMKYRYQKGSSLALYNVHRIKDAPIVYIVEGEFDAMVLQEYFDKQSKNIAVVTGTGGAGNWNDSWGKYFVGKEVHIALDNDDPGRSGAIKRLNSITQVTKNVTIDILDSDCNDICESLFVNNVIEFSEVITGIVPSMLYEFYQEKSKKRRLGIIKALFTLADEMELDMQLKLFVPFLREILKKHYDNNRLIKKEVNNYKGDDIEIIKKIPITNFIRFSGGVANCIFHNERNPSMHYNGFNTAFPNTVKCYSCGKFADVITVVMELNSCTFKEALELLKN